MERGDRELSSGLQGSHDPLEHIGFVTTAEQPEPALAEADHRVVSAVVRQLAHVHYLEARVQPLLLGSGASKVDELRRRVDAHDRQPPPGELQRVPPGPASHIEDTLPRGEGERLPEEVDLLDRSLRERIPQVRGPQEPGDRPEPVALRRWSHGATIARWSLNRGRAACSTKW